MASTMSTQPQTTLHQMAMAERVVQSFKEAVGLKKMMEES